MTRYWKDKENKTKDKELSTFTTYTETVLYRRFEKQLEMKNIERGDLEGYKNILLEMMAQIIDNCGSDIAELIVIDFSNEEVDSSFTLSRCMDYYRIFRER